MSFGEHLEELRKVLIKSLISVAIGCVFGFLLANQVVNLLTGPLVRAMTKYAQVNAVDELMKRQGFVDPELIPWMEQENLIPRQQYVDPASLIAALQTVLPEFANQVIVDSHRFEGRHFIENQIPELARSLLPVEPTPANLDPRRSRIWELLTIPEQAEVRQIAEAGSGSAAATDSMAAIFNRLTKESSIFEFSEFSADVSDPETTWLSNIAPPVPNILAEMKKKHSTNPSDQLARRINRALLTKLFAEQMQELRMNLVPLELWERGNFQPQSLGVAEPFMVWLKAGLLTGFTFAAPVVFYHLWSFVASGLYPHEQKYIHRYLPISIGLFVSGVLLAFIFVFDPVLDFLFSFNRQMGIVPQMRINDWLSFVMFLPLGFGTAFQLPLVMLFLNRLGVFQVQDYLKKWRIAVMVIFVVSMFLTPQDPISLLLLAVPLTLLYFVGIGMCLWMPQHKNPFNEPEREYTPV